MRQPQQQKIKGLITVVNKSIKMNDYNEEENCDLGSDLDEIAMYDL